MNWVKTFAVPISQAAVDALSDENLYAAVVEHRKAFIGLKGFDYSSLQKATPLYIFSTVAQTGWPAASEAIAKDNKVFFMVYALW